MSKSPKTKKSVQIGYLIAAGVLVAAVASYLFLVRPMQDKGAQAEQEVANTALQITTIQRELAAAEKQKNIIKVADLVELAKAMPDDDGQAAAMLELIGAAQGSGVNFTAIQPGPPVAVSGFTRYPLALSFVGNYYDLTEFLWKIRNLVTVRDGVLDANGRLFTVDSVNWHGSDDPLEPFPLVQADLTVSAYVYGADVNPAAVAAATGAPQPSDSAGSDTQPPPEDGSAPAPSDGTTPDTSTEPAGPSTVDASQSAAGATP